MKIHTKNIALFGALFTIAALSAGSANAIGTVRGPGVTKDKLAVEYKGVRTGDDKASKNNAQKHVGEINYGFTDRLAAGVEYAGKRTSSHSLHQDSVIAEGKYEFLEADEAFINTAFFAEYVHALRDKDADAVEIGLLGQKEFSKLKMRGNIYAVREVGNNRSHGVGFEARAYTVYKLHEYVNPGVEWQGDFNKFNDTGSFDDQQHYIGPNLIGALPIPGFSYEVAYLAGVSDAAADNAVRWKLEYSTKF
jgi:hypothetical protein